MNTSGLSRGNFLCVWTAVGGLVLAPACFGQNHPAKFSYFAIPTQSYAVVDMSGSSTATDVTMLALADGNTAAFAFQTADKKCKSYLWQNGAATLAQSFPLTGYGHFGDGDGNDIIYPGLVTTTGEVEGSFNGYWPTATDHNFLDGTFSAVGGTATPVGLESFVWAESAFLSKTADGSWGEFVIGGAYPNFSGGPCGVLIASGAKTIFVDQAALDGATANGGDPLNAKGWQLAGVPDLNGSYQNTFVPSSLNGQGNAIGSVNYDLGAISCFWDGTSLVPLDGHAVALNEQNQVIGVETASDGSLAGYLWQPASANAAAQKTHLIELLSTQERAEINNIQPILLSNQVQPGSGAPVQPVLHIIFTGSIRRSAKTQTREFATFLLRKLSDGTYDLHEIVGLPGTPSHVNTSGVLAMIGNPQTTAYTPGNNHALLLSPVTLTNLADPYRGTASNPGHNNLDTPIAFKQSDTDTNINCVAWIAAHDPNNSNAPRMPQLQAKLPGLTGCNVYWKLQVTFHDRNGNLHRDGNPHRDFDTGDPNNVNTSPYLMTNPCVNPSNYTANTLDQISVPVASINSNDLSTWHQITDSTPWNMYQESDWLAAVAQGFFGGDAILSLEVASSDKNTMLMPKTDFRFRVAGEKPDSSLCENFITVNSSGYWYAYAIAKQETAGEGSPGFYNHFLNSGGKSVPKPGKEGAPDWNDDGINRRRLTGTGGYGLFQLTYQAANNARDTGDAYYIMPRQWIWNWQANVGPAIQKLQQKESTATSLYHWLIKNFGNSLQTQTCPKSGNGQGPFNAYEGILIAMFNGNAGFTTVRAPNGTTRSSPWKLVDGQWVFTGTYTIDVAGRLK